MQAVLQIEGTFLSDETHSLGGTVHPDITIGGPARCNRVENSIAI